MDFDLFKSIIDEAVALKVPSIKLNLRGESTLYPQFKEACEYVKGKFIDIRLNTNGNYSPALNNIIASTFTEVCVSVDADTKETYERVRVGGDYELVFENLSELDINMKSLGKKLKVSFVITKDNAHELNSFKAFFKKYYPAIKLFIRHAAQRTDGDYVSGDMVAVGRKDCLMPRRRLVITWDGQIYPCCVSTWNNKFPVRSIETGLMKTWRCEPLQFVRKNLGKAEYMNSAPDCKNCFSRESYKWKKK
jgi:radical SAM protein with 4Fe4S-binding SPASM domain